MCGCMCARARFLCVCVRVYLWMCICVCVCVPLSLSVCEFSPLFQRLTPLSCSLSLSLAHTHSLLADYSRPPTASLSFLFAVQFFMRVVCRRKDHPGLTEFAQYLTTQIRGNVPVRAQTHPHTHAHTYLYTHTHGFTRARTHARTHKTHTHAHTLSRSLLSRPASTSLKAC